MTVLDPRRRSGAWTAVCVLLVALTAAPALADGMHVKKWLTLEQAVKRSTAVLLVRVIRTDSRYGSASPRGESYRYLQVFRALARVKSVLRGDPKLVGKEAWVERQMPFHPGRWIVIDELYRTDFREEEAKAASELLVLVRRTGPTQAGEKDRPRLEAFALESASPRIVTRVKKLLSARRGRR